MSLFLLSSFTSTPLDDEHILAATTFWGSSGSSKLPPLEISGPNQREAGQHGNNHR